VAGVCRICGWAEAKREGRCDTCRTDSRNGRERPEELVVAQGRRIHERQKHAAEVRRIILAYDL
jgi:hypothetical protein